MLVEGLRLKLDLAAKGLLGLQFWSPGVQGLGVFRRLGVRPGVRVSVF